MEVVAGIIIAKGRVFVAQRPLRKNHGGLWEFPGGKVDAGETHQQALARELLEELDGKVDIEKMQFLGNVTSAKIDLHFYFVPPPRFLIPKEHRAFAWKELPSLEATPLCPNDKEAVSHFNKEISEKIRDSMNLC